jgi:hypothetical protein
LETPWWGGQPLYKQEIEILRSKIWKDYRK